MAVEASPKLETVLDAMSIAEDHWTEFGMVEVETHPAGHLLVVAAVTEKTVLLALVFSDMHPVTGCDRPTALLANLLLGQDLLQCRPIIVDSQEAVAPVELANRKFYWQSLIFSVILAATGTEMSTRGHRKTRAKRRKRTELSEMVTRRARDTAALVASIRVHKGDVGATLGRRFAPALRSGETVPDYELSLELAGRSVQLAFDRLDELDDRHFVAKGASAQLAREVDRVAKQELYPQAVDVRRQIDAAFGREAGGELHGFTGRTPRSAERLRRHVERAVSRLGNRNRRLSVHRAMLGEPVDRERWQRRLEEPLRGLVAAADELGQQQAVLNAVSDERQQAMQRFDAVYSESLRFVEATFAMAGIHGQRLKSLRPTYWRRRVARWARDKRQARSDRRLAVAAVRPAEARPAETPPVEGRRAQGEGAFAAVSRWLRARRIFG